MIQKILQINSNPTDRQWLSQVLAGAGYAVIEAADGLTGIKLAEAERPDLILIELDLPGLNGYETSTHLKGIPDLSDTPVLALMSQPQSDSRERALAAGCAGCLILPLEATRLLEKVAQHLAGWQETLSLEEENSHLREYNQHLAARLEQQMREFTRANEALAHTDLMKSRFINLAGHELRTPLTGLRGYLSLLTASNSPVMAKADTNTLEIIEGINGCVDRLQGIIQDMLDMTRIEMGTLQLRHSPVSLSFILDKINREFEEVARQRQQTLTITNPDHLPMLWADGGRITQILRNLVSNAVKYTPDGGKITIQAELMSPSSAPGRGDFVKVTVIDTGVGVSPDQHEYIFNSFYEVRDAELHSSSKTDFMGGGAGLGLPIARGVAEAHGGSLQVESTGYDPERYPGSKFHLILPIGDPANG